MRLPRFILNPAVGVWVRLWQSQRKETSRLRRELVETKVERDAWRDKFLLKVAATPLYTPPPKPVEPYVMPPVGPMAKRAALTAQRGPINEPTAEEMAAVRNGN